MEDSDDTSARSNSSSPLERSHEREASSGVEVAWVASPRLIDHSWMSIAEWCQRVDRNSRLPGRLAAKMVFVGDSITEGWTTVAPQVWEKSFGAYDSLPLGIGGDQTQNILWRIDHGELDGLKPKVLVLLIGVNNIWWGGFGPEETSRGITTVATKMCEKLPHTKIVVHGIFPAGRRSQDELRQRIIATNLATHDSMRGMENVIFLDIGDIFLSSDGSIDPQIMHDYLHLTEKGYGLWASSLKAFIESYL
jgi:lysophospholipase L1-like esterase